MPYWKNENGVVVDFQPPYGTWVQLGSEDTVEVEPQKSKTTEEVLAEVTGFSEKPKPAEKNKLDDIPFYLSKKELEQKANKKKLARTARYVYEYVDKKWRVKKEDGS